MTRERTRRRGYDSAGVRVYIYTHIYKRSKLVRGRVYPDIVKVAVTLAQPIGQAEAPPRTAQISLLLLFFSSFSSSSSSSSLLSPPFSSIFSPFVLLVLRIPPSLSALADIVELPSRKIRVLRSPLNRGRFPANHCDHLPRERSRYRTTGRGEREEIRVRRSARLPPFGNLLPIPITSTTSFYLVLLREYIEENTYIYIHVYIFIRFLPLTKSANRDRKRALERGARENQSRNASWRERGEFSNRIDRHLYDRNYLKCSSCAGRLIQDATAAAIPIVRTACEQHGRWSHERALVFVVARPIVLSYYALDLTGGGEGSAPFPSPREIVIIAMLPLRLRHSKNSSILSLSFIFAFPFFRRHSLRQHMLRHAGKKYKCGLPGCPTVLRTASELRSHVSLVHEATTSTRRYKCSDCSYAAKTRTQLRR